MLKTFGYILFVICCVAWLLILVIPWLGYSKGQVAGIITGLIIIGEITFYVSLLLLGKAFWEKIKGWFRRKKA